MEETSWGSEGWEEERKEQEGGEGRGEKGVEERKSVSDSKCDRKTVRVERTSGGEGLAGRLSLAWARGRKGGAGQHGGRRGKHRWRGPETDKNKATPSMATQGGAQFTHHLTHVS